MNKMSLFDIGQEFKSLYNIANDIEFDEVTGEIIDNTNTLKDLFDEVEDTLINKLDSCQYIRKELEANSTMLATEIKRLQVKKKALDNRADKLKNIMQETFIISGDTKLKGKFSFSLGTRKTLEIQEHLTPDFFNQEYVRTKKEFDKTKITADLKSGVVIDGATITNKVNFSIR